MRWNKKGVDIWLSWVLLVGAAIIATVFMFQWMTSYATQTSDDLERTFENAQECDSVAVEIRACQETVRNVVNVNATNRGLLKIDKLIFRLYDASDDAVTRQVNVTIRPNVKKSFPIVRQNAVTDLEAIPVLRRQEDNGDFVEIICSKRITSLDTIGLC